MLAPDVIAVYASILLSLIVAVLTLQYCFDRYILRLRTREAERLTVLLERATVAEQQRTVTLADHEKQLRALVAAEHEWTEAIKQRCAAEAEYPSKEPPFTFEVVRATIGIAHLYRLTAGSFVGEYIAVDSSEAYEELMERYHQWRGIVRTP